MQMALILAVLVACSGCPIVRAISGDEDPDAVHARSAAQSVLECPLAQITAKSGSEFKEYAWTVSGCGKTAVCDGEWDEWQCFPIPLGFGTLGPRWMRHDEGYAGLTKTLALITRCPSGPTMIRVLKPKDRGDSATFNALYCGRDFTCVSEVNSALEVTDRTECEETKESVERATISDAISKLALETACPRIDIKIVDSVNTLRGTERSFRLTACGRAYVCDTADGRTDCRAALADESP